VLSTGEVFFVQPKAELNCLIIGRTNHC